MDSLLDVFHSHPIFSLLQTAFTIWMLVDVYRRGAEYFWFWVILLVPGVGAWVYFFAVKVPSGDFGQLQLGGFLRRGPSLDQLRYQAEQTPTLASHLALAERLIELGQHSEAVPHLEAALQTEPEHGRALFSLASCQRELGRPAEAIPLLERLLRRDQRWGDYEGWRLLIDVQNQTGDHAGALRNCRELVRLSPTLQHRCLLAEYLLDQGETKEAQFLLEQALRDHDYAPGPIRRRNRRWASEARRLCRCASERMKQQG
jgi:hypothetical protein